MKKFKLIYPVSFGKCVAYHASLKSQLQFIKRLPNPNVVVEQYQYAGHSWVRIIVYKGTVFTRNDLISLLNKLPADSIR